MVQVMSACDLTPGRTPPRNPRTRRLRLRFEGDEIAQTGFSTACLKSTKASLLVVISNLPTGDLTYLDADYAFRITNTSNKK